MNHGEFSISLNQNESWRMDRLHFHESIELLLSLSDGGDFFVGGDMYLIRKNTLFLFDAAVLHRSVREDPAHQYRRYILHILPSTLERLSTSRTNFPEVIHRAQPCTLLSQPQADELIRLFGELEAPAQDVFGSDVRQNILLLELMLTVCDCLESAPVESGIISPDYERVAPVLRYIQEHFTDPLSLEELAAQFSVSKYHLCHVFKNVTGFSVMEYVIQRRIILARELLRQPISVQEAGERAGFQTNSHFIRTFTSFTGMSPKRYARQYLQSDKCQYLGGLPPR